MNSMGHAHCLIVYFALRKRSSLAHPAIQFDFDSDRSLGSPMLVVEEEKIPIK